jgi:hypothetical protein
MLTQCDILSTKKVKIMHWPAGLRPGGISLDLIGGIGKALSPACIPFHFLVSLRFLRTLRFICPATLRQAQGDKARIALSDILLRATSVTLDPTWLWRYGAIKRLLSPT